MGKEKKEIGKLIELLNEYNETKKILNYDMDGQLEIDNAIYVNYPNIERLCGKQFGFIKWLVENDKINTRKIDEDRLETIQYSEKERITIYNWLLMLLAIKDEPIEFLCSILK